MKHILIGNSFPLGLIRRQVMIEPISLAELKNKLTALSFDSYWGHTNTLKTASDIAGVDLTPLQERPALTVSSDGFPVLNGLEYRECYILICEYKPGFRPSIGHEVSPDEIVAWNCLKISWPVDE